MPSPSASPGGAASWWLVIQSNSTVVYDLAGNVWEWTASEYSQDYSTTQHDVGGADLLEVALTFRMFGFPAQETL